MAHVRANAPASVGAILKAALAGKRKGESMHFSQPLVIGDHEYTHGTVLREFQTPSRSRLLELDPGGKLFVCKQGDIATEYALMCALHKMNARWAQIGVSVLGVAVEAVTYDILPLDRQIGLVQVVPESRTMRELAREHNYRDKHLRVL